jgi:hypothetical protein
MNRLNALRDSIYNFERPWRGITVNYRLDKAVYAWDDSIYISAIVVNTDTVTRLIELYSDRLISFDVFRQLGGGVQSRGAVFGQTMKPIPLNPGETRIFTVPWTRHGLKFPNQVSLNRLVEVTPGQYFVTPLLLADFDHAMEPPIRQLKFDLADSLCPIGGIVEITSSGVYPHEIFTVSLTVQNWTKRTVKLNFPTSNVAEISLYKDYEGSTDMSKPLPPNRLFYKDSIRAHLHRSIALPAGTSRVFTKTYSGGMLRNLGSLDATRIHVRLLCSSHSIEREAELETTLWP